MIKIGDRIPDATLTESTEFGDACPIAPTKVSVTDATKGKRVVLFGLPGAYTPTCSAKHVPGYLQSFDQLKAGGVSEDPHGATCGGSEAFVVIEGEAKVQRVFRHGYRLLAQETSQASRHSGQ